MPCGCFLHQTAHSNFLICAEQTAELLACLAQKSLHKTHSLRAHIAPHLLRYARARNAHLHRANSASSPFASLASAARNALAELRVES